MSMNTQGRITAPTKINYNVSKSFSGNKALEQATKLIFETGNFNKTGIDFPAAKGLEYRLGGLEQKKDIELPGLSEPEILRHYVRLSQKNYAIDLGVYPLGSCTNEIPNFTGIDSPYEAPLTSEIHLEQMDKSAAETAEMLFALAQSKFSII